MDVKDVESQPSVNTQVKDQEKYNIRKKHCIAGIAGFTIGLIFGYFLNSGIAELSNKRAGNYVFFFLIRYFFIQFHTQHLIKWDCILYYLFLKNSVLNKA